MGLSCMTVEHVPSCGRSFVSVVDSELSDQLVSSSELVCDMHLFFIGISRSSVYSSPLLVFRTGNVGTMNWCTDLQACWVFPKNSLVRDEALFRIICLGGGRTHC